MRMTVIGLAALILLAACQREASAPPAATATPLRVRSVEVKPASAAIQDTYSGIVHAVHETPIAPEAPGRIVQRHINAGDTVKAGDVLFTLDDLDATQSLNVARAELAAADAEHEIARADLERTRQLLARNAASQQALDQAVRTQRLSEARQQSAQASVALATTHLRKTRITAPFAGVLTGVSGQPGQVVAIGEVLAQLAGNGDREIEVDLPDFVTPPDTATALVRGLPPLTLTRHEVSGGLVVQSKTWRVRYRLPAMPKALPLGAAVRVQVNVAAVPPVVMAVPVGAVDERGAGPHVWRLDDGKVSAVPVQVVMMQPETALVVGALTPGQHVVALGTHLLEAGMAVAETAR